MESLLPGPAGTPVVGVLCDDVSSDYVDGRPTPWPRRGGLTRTPRPKVLGGHSVSPSLFVQGLQWVF